MTTAIPEVRRRINAAKRQRAEQNAGARREITIIGLKSDLAALAAVRTLIATDKRKLARVREDTGLSYATLANIRDGVTKYPRFSTVLSIVEAYGFRMQMTDGD